MRLLVPYRGRFTIAGLKAHYKSLHDDITDENFPSNADENVVIPVEHYELPVGMDERGILAELREVRKRPLKAAETLALGLALPDESQIGLGQVFKGRYSLHIVRVKGKEALLTGYVGLRIRGAKFPVTSL